MNFMNNSGAQYEYKDFIIIKEEHIKPFTKFKPEFPKLQSKILENKFKILDTQINFHRNNDNKNEYWVQLNSTLGFAHNRGAVAYIDDKKKSVTILYNSQSYSITRFKLNQETNMDAMGLYTQLSNAHYTIRYQCTNEEDSEQMKYDLGVYTDINPLQQQCSNSCGTAAQRFILYRYFKDNNCLDKLTKEQRKALSNDVSFWQYVHGDCDTVEKFKKMTTDRNFELAHDGSRITTLLNESKHE